MSWRDSFGSSWAGAVGGLRLIAGAGPGARDAAFSTLLGPELWGNFASL